MKRPYYDYEQRWLIEMHEEGRETLSGGILIVELNVMKIRREIDKELVKFYNWFYRLLCNR
jgi:hypothetical protein